MGTPGKQRVREKPRKSEIRARHQFPRVTGPPFHWDLHQQQLLDKTQHSIQDGQVEEGRQRLTPGTLTRSTFGTQERNVDTPALALTGRCHGRVKGLRDTWAVW